MGGAKNDDAGNGTAATSTNLTKEVGPALLEFPIFGTKGEDGKYQVTMLARIDASCGKAR